MNGGLKRALYAASYLLPFVAIAVVTVWMFQVARPPGPSGDPACEGLYDDTAVLRGEITLEQFRRDAIAQMLARSAQCLSQPHFLDTLVTAMGEAGRIDELRTLLESPEWTAALPADVIRLQSARAKVVHAQALERGDQADRADALRREALETAIDLIGRWPDWHEAYALADLAEGGDALRYAYQFEAHTRSPLSRSWFVRHAAMIWLIPVGALSAGLAALGLSYRAWSGGMQLDTAPSPIGLAAPGFAALHGTVHVPPGFSRLQHPADGPACVWFRVKRGKATIQSKQPVLLRDSSGSALMDLTDAHVEAGGLGEDQDPRMDERVASTTAADAAPPREAGIAVTKAARIVGRPFRDGRARDYLVEGESVSVFGAIAAPTVEAGGTVLERRVVGYDRPVTVLASGTEQKRATLRSETRWGLLLGVALLGLGAWVTRAMMRTGFTPWG